MKSKRERLLDEAFSYLLRLDDEKLKKVMQYIGEYKRNELIQLIIKTPTEELDECEQRLTATPAKGGEK